MYHDFFKAKEIWYLVETIDIKTMTDKLNKHTFLLFSLYAYFLGMLCNFIVDYGYNIK